MQIGNCPPPPPPPISNNYSERDSVPEKRDTRNCGIRPLLMDVRGAEPDSATIGCGAPVAMGASLLGTVSRF